MKEFIYGLRQKTGPAPKIRKLGAIKLGMEQTPVLFQGQPVVDNGKALLPGQITGAFFSQTAFFLLDLQMDHI